MSSSEERSVATNREFMEPDARYAFSPTVSTSAGDLVGAWLELSERESAARLQTSHGTASESRTIGRPMLVGGGGASYLAWSERNESGKWPLHLARIDGGAVSDPRHITEGNRRPIDITGCRTDNGAFFAWESLHVTDTEIRGGFFRDGEWKPVGTLSSNGVDAAHDVDVATTADGDVRIVYTALRDGWYEIEGRTLCRDGSLTEPESLSFEPWPVAYPTVTVDNDGHTWTGWVCYQLPTPAPDKSFRGDEYRTHRRHQLQSSFFRRGRSITVKRWDDDGVSTPVYGHYSTDLEAWDHPELGEVTAASGRVFHAYYGTRPLLLSDDGAVWLAWLDYERKSSRPRVALSQLESNRWSDPIVSETVYGDAERLHWTRGPEGKLVIANGDDTRIESTPPELRNELSGTGGCDVGVMEVPTTTRGTNPTCSRMNRWAHERPDVRNGIVSRTRTIDDQRGDERLVFLNYHQHSSLSRCWRVSDGEIGLNIRHARDLMGQDSVAMTEHGYNFDHLARYRYYENIERHHWPGEFITIPSFEWTASHLDDGNHYGHMNVHRFDGEDLPPVGAPMVVDSSLRAPDELWSALAGTDSLTIPHHTSNNHHYFRPDLVRDESYTPVVELFQDTRGSCECPNGPGSTEYLETEQPDHYVQTYLEKGHRVGFVGGGDHKGVAMTGLWVGELTRQGIYEALNDRRSFATTGTTAHIEFTIGNATMGETLTETGIHELQVLVEAPGPVQTIELLRNNTVFQEIDGDGATIDHAGQVTVKDDEEWYYCRVLLSNGDVCWSSPIWAL